MNLLLSCIGRRGYLADWFREHLAPGDRIVGTSSTAWTPGLHACDRAAMMPDVASPEYLPALLELCVSERIDGLISLLDTDVDVIANARERFHAIGVRPIVPDPLGSRVTLDKLETARFLEEQGLPAPRTFASLVPVWSGLQDGSLSYPLVVKPRCGVSSRDLFIAYDRLQLQAMFDYKPDMIVQERLLGEEYGIDLLNDLEGRVISVVVKRKVLMRGGETDQAETVHHPDAMALGERLGRALGQPGPLDVDLFINAGDVSILEVNARFGAGYPASHLAGADFPRKIVDMLRGRTLEPDIGNYAAGVSMMKGYTILPAVQGEIVDMRSGGQRRPR